MKATDWDSYYNDPSGFSKYTRLYTQNWLIEQIKKYSIDKSIDIAEFGGGNSCFHEAIIKEANINTYTIYDNNDTGVKKFEENYGRNNISKAINCDLLNAEVAEKDTYDIVMSVGLIEHFDENGTKIIVKKHFDAVKSGGIVIITAPTPTLLYNTIRSAAELFGAWKFHDERPLLPTEMYKAVEGLGEVIDEKLLWAIGLTQYALVVKKH
jgi:2-polyprenyl-3-methyl-5-hydroxy-6-metoxy-1,4-benzoquinol methylase